MTKGKVRVSVFYLSMLVLIVLNYCFFINQTINNVFGALVSTGIYMAAAAVVILSRNVEGEIMEPRKMYNCVFAVILFFLYYSLIFALGSSSLSKTVYFGVEFPKQSINGLFAMVYLIPLIVGLSKITVSEANGISKVFIILLVIAEVVYLILSFQNRDIIKTEAYDNESVFSYGYTQTYSTAVLIPALLTKARKSVNRTIPTIVFLLSILTVYRSGYFIAVIGVVLSMAIYLILNIKQRWLRITVLLLTITIPLYLLLSGTLSALLQFAQVHTSIPYFKGRFEEINRFLNQGLHGVDESNTTYRFVLYLKTFKGFLEHPIFGNFVFGSYDCLYDHTVILDILSAGGILLAAAFLAMLRRLYRYSQLFQITEADKKTLLTCLLTYLFLSVINPVLDCVHLGMIFVVVPILLMEKKK